MASPILSSLFSIVDSRGIGEIASRFAQPRQAISEGLDLSTASILTALANQTGDSTRMDQLHRFISKAPATANVSDLINAVSEPSRVSSGISSLLDSGKSFLSLALGGNESSIFDAVARSTGLRSGVVSSLMSVAAPALMAALGRMVREDHLNAAGLGRILVHEGESARDLLPANVSNLLHLGPQPAPSPAIDSRPIAIDTYPEPSRSRAWWWLVPALLVPLLVYWAYQTRYRLPAARMNSFVVRMLPGHVALNIPPNGVEGRLLTFVQDPSLGIDSVAWFDFDRLKFDSHSATLLPESQEQLTNIAKILKAYPAVQMIIGGFTDSTGDAAKNMKLSQDRASAVRARLVALGISPNRLDAKGYGAQYPIADNASADGRARNRRVSMRVTQK